MHRFKGKVIIVTGAGSGIGAGIARRFLQEGAFVVVNGVILPVDGGLSASNGQPNFLSLLGQD